MKAILIKPYDKREIVDIDGKLETLQKLVGGYIEPLYRSDGTVLLFDEEGNLKGLEPNIAGLVGNILIVRTDGEDFIGLTNEDLKNYIQ